MVERRYTKDELMTLRALKRGKWLVKSYEHDRLVADKLVVVENGDLIITKGGLRVIGEA